MSAAVCSSAEGLRHLARKLKLRQHPAACCGLGGPVQYSALLPLRHAGFPSVGLGDLFCLIYSRKNKNQKTMQLYAI